MTDPSILAQWIGAILSAPSMAPTEFMSWRLDQCCSSQGDLYLSGRDWSLVVDAPWTLLAVGEDVLEVKGWAAAPAAILRRSRSERS